MGCTSCSLRRRSSKSKDKKTEDIMIMSPTGRRALHYVLKVGNRKAALKFFTSVMEMKVLRHEEFDIGCDAMCNGPYGGRWSKTMVGYEPEDANFALEIVYNYGISGYNKDNELISIEIMKENVSSVVAAGGMIVDPMTRDGIAGLRACVIDFEEYRFKVFEDEGGDRIGRIVLACRDIQKTEEFWMQTLEMSKINESLYYGIHQCKVQFKGFELTSLDEAEAYGRIAFSCPRAQLKEIEEKVGNCKSGGKVHVPLVTLPTPGKADVEVVILKDPDGHEICFTGDDAFRELSVFDPKAEKYILECIANDKSDEWFAQKRKSKMVVESKKNMAKKKSLGIGSGKRGSSSAGGDGVKE